MAFIDTIAPAQATGDTREMYARQQAHYGYVPSYAQVFCHRPQIMELWGRLLAGIKRPMDKRRFELATFAAARALRSTLCSVAHGKALLEFFSADDVMALARGEVPGTITPAEVAVMAFARKVALDAAAVTVEDIAALKEQGLEDPDIFDIAVTAAGRAFFTKVIESLGAKTDAPLRSMAPELRHELVAGRPIEFAATEALSG